MMLNVITKDMLADNETIEKVFFNRMLFTYVHEIAHNMNAPDHYCYNFGEGKCDNKNCIKCYKNTLTNNCSGCIMLIDPPDNVSPYLREHWNTIICGACKNNINVYLNTWCSPAKI